VDGNFKQRRKLSQTPPDNSTKTRSTTKVPMTTKTPGRKIIPENKTKRPLSPITSKPLEHQKILAIQKTPSEKKLATRSLPQSATKHAAESKSRAKPIQTPVRPVPEPRTPQPSQRSPPPGQLPLPPPTQTRPTFIDLGLKVGATINSSGILILDIKPDSLSAKAGLRVGDIITAANGTPVSNISQYNLATSRLKSGAAPVFKVNRGAMHLQILIKIPSQSGTGYKGKNRG